MSTTIAITGGIACGKSHSVSKIIEQLNDEGSDNPVRYFSCDEAVSKLLTDNKTIGLLTSNVGHEILHGDGSIDRSKLRDLIFADSVVKRKIEEILHPSVLDMAVSFLKESEKSRYLLVEVPLLYEADFPLPRDIDIVIGCSRQTQLRRLSEYRNIQRDQAIPILESQLPIQTKIENGHFVIWNDGSLESFDDQLHKLTNFITSNFGS